MQSPGIHHMHRSSFRSASLDSIFQNKITYKKVDFQYQRNDVNQNKPQTCHLIYGSKVEYLPTLSIKKNIVSLKSSVDDY